MLVSQYPTFPHTPKHVFWHVPVVPFPYKVPAFAHQVMNGRIGELAQYGYKSHTSQNLYHSNSLNVTGIFGIT